MTGLTLTDEMIARAYDDENKEGWDEIQEAGIKAIRAYIADKIKGADEDALDRYAAQYMNEAEARGIEYGFCFEIRSSDSVTGNPIPVQMGADDFAPFYAPPISEHIKAIRKRLGLSQAEMGRKLGFLPGDKGRTVRKWEAGEHRPPRSALELYRLLDEGWD